MTPIQPPMTDERLDRLVRQLLTERADDVAAVAMPAPSMAAVVASHVRRGGMAGHRQLLLVAAALLVLLAAGAVAIGAGFLRETVQPQPTPLPVVPAPSDHATVPERVYYTDYRESHVGDPGCPEDPTNRLKRFCASSRIWVADADGSDARELFPDSTDLLRLVDVSDAGDALLFRGPAELDGQRINATYLASVRRDGAVLATTIVSDEVVDDGCEGLCTYDEWHTFSPDGKRVAFVRFTRAGEDDYEGVVSIKDLSTGRVVELEATRAGGSAGSNGAVAWSPDGSMLLVNREGIGVATPEHRLLDQAVFVVNADGTELRQLTAMELFGRDGTWSPDGSSIAFTSAVGWLGVDELTGKRENFMEDNDVYTIRPDGSGLRRLTNFAPTPQDRGSPARLGGRVSGWTRDGQIVFTLTRWGVVDGLETALAAELSVMDPDGANARQLDGTYLASLAAAGCVDCPYPPHGDLPEMRAFWRPAR